VSTVVDRHTESMLTRRFPPVAAVTTLSLAAVVVGGVVMASYIPRRPPMGVAILLLGVGVVLLAVAVGLLVRLRPFAWNRFFQVFRWALLAYVISAAMIEFAFVHDHTRGAPLVVVTAMLVVFALDVPTVIAFTVARYQDPGPPPHPG
jgi:hypothetical protein